jgi:hypothetical protein
MGITNPVRTGLLLRATRPGGSLITCPKPSQISPISIFPAYHLPKFSTRKEFIIELLCQIKEVFGLGTTCTAKRIYIEKT